MLANGVDHVVVQGESTCSKERGESTWCSVEHKSTRVHGVVHPVEYLMEYLMELLMFICRVESLAMYSREHT